MLDLEFQLMTAPDKLPLLLVEDSEDDRFFFCRLLTKAGLKSPLGIAMDGQEAIAHFQRILAANGAQPLPRLVFLDLKLPHKSGFEVLAWIRGQPELAGVVVVILSSSGETRDVVQAYKLGAQGYLVKYPEAKVLAEAVQRVGALPEGASFNALTLPGIPKPA
jgi:CheY-like chemotaxis protein